MGDRVVDTIERYHLAGDVRVFTRNDRRRLVALEEDLEPCYEHLEQCVECPDHQAILRFTTNHELVRSTVLRRYDHYDCASAVLVRAVRRAGGLSKAELARRLGCTGMSVTGYELGTQTPSITRMRRLLVACGAG